MYTWGYIKQAVLAKMDMDVDQAVDQGLVNKMPYYANEALTQITSAIKAKRTYVTFDIVHRKRMLKYIENKYHFQSIDFLFNPPCDELQLNAQQLEALKLYQSKQYVGDVLDMPNDFLFWADDIVYKDEDEFAVDGKDFVIIGSSKIRFNTDGKFYIPYKCQWYFFEPTTDDYEKLDIPADIIEALIPYIASQLYKIDDEQKSAIYRNEYELAIARIDDNEYITNKSFVSGGDW